MNHEHCAEKPSNNLLTYNEAFDLAVDGKVNGSVLIAMRREHVEFEKAGVPLFHRIHVMTSLGAALLQYGNQVQDPRVYSSIYRESEEILISALKLQPEHSVASHNLEKVRRSISARQAPAGGSKPLDWSTFDEGAVDDQEDSSSGAESATLSYEEALASAVQGRVDESVVRSFREEHARAMKGGNAGAEHLLSVKINLGVALLNQGNHADPFKFVESYKESEQMFMSILAMRPGHEHASRNLATVRNNLLMRERPALFNPHVVFLGHETCRFVVIRRLQKEQLSASLFTCDNRTDRALIWYFESEEDIDAHSWYSSFRMYRPGSRTMAYDARSLIWRGELCWISSAGGQHRGYMLFHCIRKDRFLQQMKHSMDDEVVVPLMHARGGELLAPHAHLRSTEKNWSPFVIGDELYITYSINPYIVLHCDWERSVGLVKCNVVQNRTSRVHESVPHLREDVNLRGSSTAIPLTKGSSEFLALGHVQSFRWRENYKFFFYRFAGSAPPFQLTGFSDLFTLPLPSDRRGSGQYAHGICMQSRDLLITYGLNDETSWYVKVPAKWVASRLDRIDAGDSSHSGGPFSVVTNSTPKEFPHALFGKDMYSVLLDMEISLRLSGHPFARRYDSFMADLPTMSSQKYATEARKFREGWLQATSKLQQHSKACESYGVEGGACRNYADTHKMEDDCIAASRAYYSLLIHENRVLRKLRREKVYSRGIQHNGVEQGERDALSDADSNPKKVTAEQSLLDRPHDSAISSKLAAAPVLQALQVEPRLISIRDQAAAAPSRSQLSYADAMQQAVAGKVDLAVLDAIRAEHERAGAEGSESRAAEVKVNLGVALMQYANFLTDLVEAKALYQESEAVLSAALRMNPSNTIAEQNLAAVRKNIVFRFGYLNSIIQEMQSDRYEIKSKTLQNKSTAHLTNQLSFSEAFDLAVDGKVNGSVLIAMRREHVEFEKAGVPLFHRIHVMTSLGAALLQYGNQVQDPRVYSSIYRESEEILISALKLQPEHSVASHNLEKVRRSISARQAPAGGSKPLDWSTFDEGAVDDQEDSSSGAESATLSYEEALASAVQGRVDESVVRSFREEHARAMKGGNAGAEHLLSVKINLGVALLNQGNHADPFKFVESYKESEQMFMSILAMRPGHEHASRNLATVRNNLLMRERPALFNPHVVFLGHETCRFVVIRRLQKEQLSASLFTCDNRTDRALIWYFESEEDIDAHSWYSSFRMYRPGSRTMAYDARSLIWRGELCWISSAGGQHRGYMLFHCIRKDRFLQQMKHSMDDEVVVPLMHARGGELLAPHAHLRSTEKNWSPFVIGDELYITYSINPYIVLHCDWERSVGLVKCNVVQNRTSRVHESVPHLREDVNLRGSSTAIPLTKGSSEFLALGHVQSFRWRENYKFFFYRFAGSAPPFQLTGFSDLFTLPLPSDRRGSGQYAHGICMQSRDLLITYGLNDETSWYVKVPAKWVASRLDRIDAGDSSHSGGPFSVVTNSTPKEFPHALFGKDMYSVLLDMEISLRLSGHPFARRYDSFMADLPTMSSQKYATEARKFREGWLQATSKLQQHSKACESYGVEGGACRNYADTHKMEDDCIAASRAYYSLLIHENRVLRKLRREKVYSRGIQHNGVEQGERDALSDADSNPKKVTAEQSLLDRPHDSAISSKLAAAPVLQALQVEPRLISIRDQAAAAPSRSQLSYADAMQQAVAGKVDLAVLDAIRAEHERAGAEGSESRAAEVKVNLGVALMQYANFLTDLVEAKALYQESEAVLSAALRMNPSNTIAEQNLAAVRKNMGFRQSQAQRSPMGRIPCSQGSPIPVYT